MNSNFAILIMVLSAILAAYSQVLLKSSSNRKNRSGFLGDILNIRVISAYFILILTMFMNIFAYNYVNYKLGPIIGTLSYIFVIIFSRYFFNEKISKNMIIGSSLIIAGIIVYNI